MYDNINLVKGNNYINDTLKHFQFLYLENAVVNKIKLQVQINCMGMYKHIQIKLIDIFQSNYSIFCLNLGVTLSESMGYKNLEYAE